MRGVDVAKLAKELEEASTFPSQAGALPPGAAPSGGRPSAGRADGSLDPWASAAAQLRAASQLAPGTPSGGAAPGTPGGGAVPATPRGTPASASALVDSLRADLQSALDRQGETIGNILSNGMGQVGSALAAQVAEVKSSVQAQEQRHNQLREDLEAYREEMSRAQKEVGDTTARLEQEMQRMRSILGIMEEARPLPPPPAPTWARDVDHAIVVITSKVPLPMASLEGALREVVASAELDGKYKFEGEEMGTKFFMRMEGSASLAEQRVRKLLGCMRIGQGKDLSWRSLSAALPTGGTAPISLSTDKNGRQVSLEITAKRMRKMVEPVLGQRVFVNPIGPHHAEVTLSVNWRQFFKIAVEGAGATPTVQWNMRALDHLGLDRSKLQEAIQPLVEPDVQEWVL